MERRRRHRAGGHLSAPEGSEQTEPGEARALIEALLDPGEALELDAHGSTEAAVLVPLVGWPSHPELIFTERRHDLRRHAGEISFPGGRRDPGEELVETAIREAEEEIGLTRDQLSIAGALPPIGTFVTSYKVHPFVAMLGDGELGLRASPTEVERILRFGLAELVAGYGERRLIRRGMPFKTPTYVVDGALIWGATARILGELLERLPAAGPG